MPPAGSETHQRPRTRAWVKAQEAATLLHRREESSSAPRPPKPSAKAKTPVKPSSAQPQRKAPTRAKRSGPKKAAPKEAARPSKSRSGKTSQRPGRLTGHSTPPAYQDKAVQTEEHDHTAPELPDWLDEVRSVSPERLTRDRSLYNSRIPRLAPDPSETMASSSADRSGVPTEGESTARGSGKKPSPKLTKDKLRTRRIQRIGTVDSSTAYLKTIVKISLPRPTTGQIPKLATAAQIFIDKTREEEETSEICHAAIEEFSVAFDEGKVEMNYPIISSKYFEAYLEKCKSKNEAVLQRTVMMSIFHQYWLGKIFDWNTEGQWKYSAADTLLPSTTDDTLSLPRPDLAICFTLQSFTGERDDSDPIPPDLRRVISPDGEERCFPFLFMEVKKATADLHDAELANLHTASQALYNMYQWMIRVGKEKEFFQDVRVFSFVFNAQDLLVRVHRVTHENGTLTFCFAEFMKLRDYDRDQACLLVSTILNNYATNVLHRILKATFQLVIAQEVERVLAKRKQDAERVTNPKRARRSGDSIRQASQSAEPVIEPLIDTIQHTSNSFGMAGLSA